MPLPLIPIALAAAGGAIAGGATGFLSTRKANRERDRLRAIAGAPLPSFSGERPPGVTDLRGIESSISQILQQRAAGQDVGFDPARLTALKESFDIGQERQLREAQARTINELSGTGQSRNLAARQATLGRQRELAGEARRQTFLGFDIEDLASRQQERDINTERLRQFNRFQFGQENIGSEFDLNRFNIETSAELRRRSQQLGIPINESIAASTISQAVEGGTSAAEAFIGGATAFNRQAPATSFGGGGDALGPPSGVNVALQEQLRRKRFQFQR